MPLIHHSWHCTRYPSVLRYFNVVAFITADLVLVIHRYFGTSTWWLSSLLTLYWLFIGTSVLQRGGFHHCWPCTGYSSVLRYFNVVAFITADLVLVIHRYFGTSTWWLSSLLTLYWLFIGTSVLQRGGFHHCWPCTGYSSVRRYLNVVDFITADLVLVIRRYFNVTVGHTGPVWTADLSVYTLGQGSQSVLSYVGNHARTDIPTIIEVISRITNMALRRRL